MSGRTQLGYGYETSIILDATGEDSGMMLSKDFRNAVFTIVASGSFAGTIKFFASNQRDGRPSLGSAASASNEYATTVVVDLEDGNNIEGDTGVVFSGTGDGVHKYEINQNGNNFIGVKATTVSAGQVQVFIDLYDNK